MTKVNLNKMAMENMVGTMLNFFNDIQAKMGNNTIIDCFLGGSYRFGYATNDSDIDFFICVKDNSGVDYSNVLYSQLYDNGFSLSKTDHAGYPDTAYYNTKLNIHVVVMYVNNFEFLRKEHNKVEKYLKEHPLVLEYIKLLKEEQPDIKGAYIYRALVKVIRGDSF